MRTQILRKAALAALLSLAITEPARAGPLGIPTTAQEHQRAAEDYEARAAAWRKWAAYHRQLGEAYRSRSDAGLADGLARVHCAAIAQDADRLAADAEDFARFHRARAARLRAR
mgnify:CR=1 FL=1